MDNSIENSTNETKEEGIWIPIEKLKELLQLIQDVATPDEEPQIWTPDEQGAESLDPEMAEAISGAQQIMKQGVLNGLTAAVECLGLDEEMTKIANEGSGSIIEK